MTDPHIGQFVGERFQIASLLGEGGMGIVYFAEDKATSGQAAVKFLHRHLLDNQEFVARFRQEAKSASRFRHENAVRILAAGDAPNGVPYIAMDFCPGRSLRAVIDEDGPLPYHRAARIAEQMLRALSEAHKNGIIHRDLKPDNIKVESRNGEDIVKVLDFGVAKFIGSPGGGELTGAVKTKTGVVFGTPKYMAPEQILGEQVDGRSDIYSVGAILYEMLAGKPPFESDDIMEFVSKHLTEAVPPIHRRNPAVQTPPGLERKALEMLDKNRVARPARAADVAEALLAYTKPGMIGGAGDGGGRLFRLGHLAYLAGGAAGAAGGHILTSKTLGLLPVTTGCALGLAAMLAFYLFPRVGEGAFWIRAALVAVLLTGAGAAARFGLGIAGWYVFSLPIAAFLLFILFAMGWGRRRRIAGPLLGGLLTPVIAAVLLIYQDPARPTTFRKLWDFGGDLSIEALAPAVAVAVLSISFSFFALFAPRARKGVAG